MFEIIMLFAFLYAATCQLFPKEPATRRSSSKKGYRPREAKNSVFNLPTQNCLPSKNRLRSQDHGATQKKLSKTQKKSLKTKGRSHSYADAA